MVTDRSSGAARPILDSTRRSSVGVLARQAPRCAHKPLVAFRLGEALMAWLRANAEGSGRSMTALVRDLLEDARSIYGLPGPVVERLEADAAALGLDLRGYVRHVLFRRFEQLKEQGLSSAAPIGQDGPLRNEPRTAVQLRVR